MSQNTEESEVKQFPKIRFNTIFKKFLTSNSPDIVKFEDLEKDEVITTEEYEEMKINNSIPKASRIQLRNYFFATKNQKGIDWLKAREKFKDKVPLPIWQKNPFELLCIENKTEVQQLAEKHLRTINAYGAYAYECACGSGKTLAGILYIFTLKVPTLIISARTAVNMQWLKNIKDLYPETSIWVEGADRRKKKDFINANIWIYTPQYLARRISENEIDKELCDIKPGLIIYDEIHSLMSEVFRNVLCYPFIAVSSGIWSEMPIMLALSATMPSEGTKERMLIELTFGKPFHCKSPVLTIPIYFIDYRDGITDRGKFDDNYSVPDEFSVVKRYADVLRSKGIDPTSTEKKGLVITSTVDYSIINAIYLRKKFKCSVLIVRAENEPSIFLDKKENLELDLNWCVDYNTIKDYIVQHDSKGAKYCGLEKIDEASIICGTLARLKEGFSVQNITWGIATRFPYSIASRTQILGRIRRYSNNEELNKTPRFFFVCSSKVPSNVFALSRRVGYKKAKEMGEIQYDFRLEETVFRLQNYIRLLC